MSRIGKKTILLSTEVQAKIENSNVSIHGPKGQLSFKLHELITIQKIGNNLKLKRNSNSKKAQELYGLSRTIINNMVIGVSRGFTKQLIIQGVGYRSQINDKNLVLNVGYSHPVKIIPPQDIQIKVENNTKITISGINKETVGQIAAQIRSIRPPEPYKGKGIKYLNEDIKRKVGKAGK
uniref:Ribosomal protein L6 n=1 Tax=Callithamnion tetricum TaxID=193179 RepID=A0A4D6WM45_9FLOR|nr:ribosomal protein L6 [Callithamnion tetricum]